VNLNDFEDFPKWMVPDENTASRMHEVCKHDVTGSVREAVMMDSSTTCPNIV